MLKRFAIATATLAAGAAPAFAHTGLHEQGSLMAGLSHPLFGADHVLAMVAVGLWAAQIGGRAVWVVPAAFVGMMIVGFGLGLSGLSLPFVEPVILASVVVLGLLVAASVKLPVVASASVVGTFAIFHGVAHASEVGSAGALSFAVGFAISTVLLHAAGVGLGLGINGFARVWLTRALGAGTAVAGLALMAG